MDCKTWLKELLENCRHISGKSAYAAGKVVGFKKIQIKAAKKELRSTLNLKAVKIGTGAYQKRRRNDRSTN